MLHEWVKLTLLFAIGAVAIAYAVADLALALYVARYKASRPDLQPLAEVMGFGPVQHLRRFAFVHSARATQFPDSTAGFWIGALRLTTLPAFVGVTSLFALSVAGVM